MLRNEVEEYIERVRYRCGAYVGIFCVGDYYEPTWEVEPGESISYWNHTMKIDDGESWEVIDYNDISYLEVQFESFYDD